MYSLKGRRVALAGIKTVRARPGCRTSASMAGPKRKPEIQTSPPNGQGSNAQALEAGKAVTVGAGAGLLGSLVGMGGGFIAIPSLTGWLRLTQHQAHGTSLGAVFAAGVAGSGAYALAGHVDLRAAAAMSLGGMAGAHVGARATANMSPSALKLALGILMVVVAPLLPFRDSMREHMASILPEKTPEQSSTISQCVAPEVDKTIDSTAKVSPGKAYSMASPSRRAPTQSLDGSADKHEDNSDNNNVLATRVNKVLKMSMIGLGSGFLAGVFGVGGGVVTVPAISLATDLSHKEVLGTSLAAMVLPALTGSATHLKQGNLVPRVALPLAIGTSLGAFLGGNCATRYLDDDSLKLAFSGLMFVLGGRTIFSARAAAIAAKAARLKV